MTAEATAIWVSPMPTKIPIAEVIQISAAVVRPWTCSLVLMMIPAPKKPMPTTTLAMTVKKPLFLAKTSFRFSGEFWVMM